MSLRRKMAGILAAALAVGALAATPASADKVKVCDTGSTSPNEQAQGEPFVTTETQTSACNSQSDTGEVILTTNRGGHPK